MDGQPEKQFISRFKVTLNKQTNDTKRGNKPAAETESSVHQASRVCCRSAFKWKEKATYAPRPSSTPSSSSSSSSQNSLTPPPESRRSFSGTHVPPHATGPSSLPSSQQVNPIISSDNSLLAVDSTKTHTQGAGNSNETLCKATNTGLCDTPQTSHHYEFDENSFVPLSDEEALLHSFPSVLEQQTASFESTCKALLCELGSLQPSHNRAQSRRKRNEQRTKKDSGSMLIFTCLLLQQPSLTVIFSKERSIEAEATHQE